MGIFTFEMEFKDYRSIAEYEELIDEEVSTAELTRVKTIWSAPLKAVFEFEYIKQEEIYFLGVVTTLFMQKMAESKSETAQKAVKRKLLNSVIEFSMN